MPREKTRSSMLAVFQEGTQGLARASEAPPSTVGPLGIVGQSTMCSHPRQVPSETDRPPRVVGQENATVEHVGSSTRLGPLIALVSQSGIACLVAPVSFFNARERVTRECSF